MEKVTNPTYSIKQIKNRGEITPEVMQSLVDLLQNAVSNNYAVGFMNDSSKADFIKFWNEEFDEIGDSSAIFLALNNNNVLGSVILSGESRANGKHRAEFRKLLVHSKSQNQGIGSALEKAATEYARANGVLLLYLDSATDFLVEGVYEKWGWKKSGEIPDYARNPDGKLVSTWFFYKQLTGDK
jgi:acetyltransferase